MPFNFTLLATVLLCCTVFATSVLVDQIGPAPQKIRVPLFPIARYPAKKHKPLKVAKSDLPSQAFDLADLINNYRHEAGLGKLNLSPSLMLIANAHAFDFNFIRQNEEDSSCGVYSWSDNSPLWTSCCSDNQNLCFDKKIEQITSYPGVGVELVFATNYTLRTETLPLILSAWTKSKEHNDVILNKEWWTHSPWKSIGVGVNSEGFATVWFGAVDDLVSWASSTSSPSTDPGEIPTQYFTSRPWNPTSPWNPTEVPRTWSPWSPPEPRTWYPTQFYPIDDVPTQPNWKPEQHHHHEKEGFHWKHANHMRNHIYELWLLILSALVIVLVATCVLLIRTIRQQRQDIRVLMLTSHGTSCAIPEKC